MTYTSGSKDIVIRAGLNLRLSWTRTGTSGNNSLINVKLQLIPTEGYYVIDAPGSPATVEIIVNGTSYKKSGVDCSMYYAKLLHEVNVTLPHNSDGSQTLRLYASATASSGIWLGGSPWYSSSLGTYSWDLPALKKMSSFTLGVMSFTFGQNIPVTISREPGQSLHMWASLHGAVLDSWDFGPTDTLPAALIATARQMQEAPKVLTTSDRGPVVISMEVLSGSTVIARSSKTLTGVLPINLKPVITSLGTTAVNPKEVASTYQATYIQTISQVKVQIVADPADQYVTFGGINQGSWYEIVVDGKYYSGNGITSDVLSSSPVSVKARLRDSRGRWSDWVSKSLTVDAYAPPEIVTPSAQRYTSGGQPSPAGGNLGIYAMLKGKPPLMIAVWSTETGTGAITNHLSETNTTGTYELNRIFPGLPIGSEYNSFIKITDKYGYSASWHVHIFKGEVPFIIGKTGIGVNVVPTKRGVEVGGNIFVDGDYYVGDARFLEMGSNANGSYYKFASGLLICTNYFAQGAWTSAFKEWVFPHLFSENPQSVMASPMRNDTASSLINVGNVSNRACNLRRENYTLEIGLFLTAIGRWR